MNSIAEPTADRTLSLAPEQNLDVQARVRGDELEVSVPLLEIRDLIRPRGSRNAFVDVNIDNGWTAITDRSAAERARTKIARKRRHR